MPRPLLPQHGINVPTPLIYSAALSAPVLRTWMQLRGLAWEKLQTPQFPMLDFARFVSKSPSTIYGHMAILRSLGALRWRSYRNGTLTVSFPNQEMEALPTFQNPGILESASLKDLMITNHNNIFIRDNHHSWNPKNWTNTPHRKRIVIKRNRTAIRKSWTKCRKNWTICQKSTIKTQRRAEL